MKILIAFFSLMIFHGATAQRIIDSKFKASLSYGSASGIGDEWYINGNYTAPSFVNNFQTGSSLNINLTYKIKNIWGVNLKIGKSNFNNWKNDNSVRFANSELSILSTTFQVGMTTAFKETGIWNKLNLSGFVGPSMQFNSQRLRKPVYSHSGGSDMETPDARSFGIAADAVADVLITNMFFAGISYTYNYQTGLPLTQYESDKINYGSINLRVGIRFAFNKRFKYQSQCSE